MKSKELESLLHLSQREIAKIKGCSQTNVKYWLNKHNLKTRQTMTFETINKTCEVCCRNYIFDRKKGHSHSRCNSCRTSIIRKNTKIKLVKLFGSKCNRCNYNKILECLEFHHVDPNTKSFNISDGIRKNMSFKKILGECSKCELLCSNCHREEHISLIYYDYLNC